MRVASAKTKTVVGGFVLLALLSATAAVLFLGDGLPMFKERRSYEVVLRDASGLQVGAPVKIGGLQVGHVADLGLAYEGEKVAVTARLEVVEPHFRLVHEGAEVRLATQGVLGDRFIALTGGAPGAPELPDGGRLRSVEPVSFEEVVQRSNQVLEGFVESLESVKAFADALPRGNEMRTATKELAAAVAEVRQAAAKVNRGEGTLGLLINDTGLHDDARALLGRTNRSKTARSLIQEAVRSDTAPAH